MPLENPLNQKVIARVMTAIVVVVVAVERTGTMANATTSMPNERRREILEMSVQMPMNASLYIKVHYAIRIPSIY